MITCDVSIIMQRTPAQDGMAAVLGVYNLKIVTPDLNFLMQ